MAENLQYPEFLAAFIQLAPKRQRSFEIRNRLTSFFQRRRIGRPPRFQSGFLGFNTGSVTRRGWAELFDVRLHLALLGSGLIVGRVDLKLIISRSLGDEREDAR